METLFTIDIELCAVGVLLFAVGALLKFGSYLYDLRRDKVLAEEERRLTAEFYAEVNKAAEAYWGKEPKDSIGE